MTEMLMPILCGVSCIGIAFLAVVGVVALLWFNQTQSKKLKTVPQNWSTVPGRITASRVELSARTHFDDDDMYVPFVEFVYVVGDTEYTGKQVIGRGSQLQGGAKKKLAQYPPGTEILVHYNPEQPGESRLLIK